MERLHPVPEDALDDTVEPQKPPQWWDMDQKMFDGEADDRDARQEAFNIYGIMKQFVYTGIRKEKPAPPQLLDGIYKALHRSDELTLDHVALVAQRELANGFDDLSDKDRATNRDYIVANATRRLLNEALAPQEEHILFPPQEQPHESNGAGGVRDYQNADDR